jgi:hypothetical protein
MCTAEFRQRPNFSDFLTENICKELATFDHMSAGRVRRYGIGQHLKGHSHEKVCDIIPLKGQSYENVCEIIALNDRLDSN